MRRTLLIVDDVKTNREILKKILGDEYNILEASNGQEALEVMNRNYTELSVLLLDLSMPVMDGFEVLLYMRERPNLNQIPVVVTTGVTGDASEEKALQYGANDYISKPYNTAIIRQRIRNVINLRETAAEVNESRRDRLTGLLNRSSFFDKAALMINKHPAGTWVIGCVDIDNFKVINDLNGTEKGDQVLYAVAGLLRDCVEQMGGLSCRMMADHFAVLYPASYLDSQLISQLHDQLVTADPSVSPIALSFGCYIVDDPMLSVSAMYDRAMLAKASIKGRYDTNTALFNESMRDHLLAEQRIVSEMKSALDSGQFEPWFQPQFNHANGKLIGGEGLVRWRHPELGLIPPGDFIPVFEKNGFVYALDKYIWEQACICLRRWIDEGRNPLPISVNISRYDVLQTDILDVLVGLIGRYQLPVELLRLEITESAFSGNTGGIVHVVRQLLENGFTVEIDDFGSGYSSLNTLKDVPAQILKLDMKFLESTDASQRSGNILESVVRMAKWLDMSVIAEGVETPQQADFLKSIGCFYVQGYLYAKPMPRKAYEALAKGGVKEREMMKIEAVENLDNNAFWNPDSLDTLIFNSYLGAACICEFFDEKLELLRSNDKFIQTLTSVGITQDIAMKLNWMDYLDEETRQQMDQTMQIAADSGMESSGELVFLNLPGCEKRTYLRFTVRVIATTGERKLIYSTIENITDQRLAEQEREEAARQLSFLENVAHELLTAPDTNAGIQTLMEKAMTYFDGDRCYIFEYDLTKETTSNTYELCAPGVRPEKDNLQKIQTSNLGFWTHAFDRQDFLLFENVDALGSEGTGKEMLLAQGVHSLVGIPLKKKRGVDWLSGY